MIKISVNNIEQICYNYTEYVLSKGFKKNNIYFDYLHDSTNFRRFISCPPDKLCEIINDFNQYFPQIDLGSEDWISFKNYMIGQYETMRKEYSYKLLDELNIKVCPYCNRQYTFVVNKKKKISPQFDHFFNKSDYPYLALSFYNLIPCCPTCNHTKGCDSIKINPYISGFGEGVIKIDNLFNCMTHGEGWNIIIDTDDDCSTNVEAFALSELYEQHKDYAEEIVLKAVANEKSYLEGLKNTFHEMNLSDDMIERVLWGNYLNEDDFAKRPLSKMASDIIKQVKG